MQLDEIQKILGSDPDNVEALQYLAIHYAGEENFTEARQCLEKAIKLAPANLALRLNLANILKAQNELGQAEDILRNIISIEPQSAAAFNNLGTIYFAREEWPLAIQAYEQAIDIQPDYADAYYNMGLALGKNHQFDKALNVYDALLSLVPKHVGAEFQRACILMQQHKFDQAVVFFSDIEKMFPHHFETQTNLAACYLRTGAIEQAKSHYLKATELLPDDTQTIFNLGVISAQQGRLREAIDYYQRCLRINPDYFEAHHNLGAVYLVMKDRAAAVSHLREAVRLRPDDEAVRHTLAIVEGKQPLATSPAYIQSLFDSYADHYDQHVVSKLSYQVPKMMLEMLEGAGLKSGAGYHILDMGCGTGLCGELLKPYASGLVGVDLSVKMLDEAGKKNCYTTLIQRDFLEFTEADNRVYDLIVAGDAMVYLADLSKIFKNVKRLLKPDGLFIFNIELNAGADEVVPGAGRFAHHPKHIEKLIHDNGFRMLASREVTLRTQEDKPVQGMIYLLQ